MDRITFEKSNCKQETTSSWFIALMHFGLKLDFFGPSKQFNIKMKEVKFNVYQKLITLMMSIAMVCEYTKDINEKLGPEVLAANIFNMDKFPDQSQINTLLTRMDDDSIRQLKGIHHKLFMQNSYSVHNDKDVVVDIDQSGLIANGKSYELADKGYFSKKKNQRGYQISAAFAGEYSETAAMYLDSGNTHCSSRFEGILSEIISTYKEQLKSHKLIIRTDSGYGSAENIEKMNAFNGLQYVAKAFSTVKAANLAKDIPYDSYIQVGQREWVYKLLEQNGVRYIIVQILTRSGKLKYTVLTTNISKKHMNAVDIFHFCNKRQTIEAFFKTVKNVYSIKNLRTTKFYGIYGFLWTVFITHNLIAWFKISMLKGTELEGVGIKVLVKKLGSIKGYNDTRKQDRQNTKNKLE